MVEAGHRIAGCSTPVVLKSTILAGSITNDYSYNRRSENLLKDEMFI